MTKVGIVLAATLQETVTLVSSFGALLGVIGLLIKYFLDYQTAQRAAEQRDAELEQEQDTSVRSIAIAEIEKAIPGLGELVDRYRADSEHNAIENARLKQDIISLEAKMEDDRVKCAADIRGLREGLGEVEYELRLARQKIQEMEAERGR